MKKLLLTLITLMLFGLVKAQETIGPVERKLTDSICAELQRLDLSKATNKAEAVQIYTNCVIKYADLLPDLATEKKIDMTDQDAMRSVGIELGKNLLREKCPGFIQLSALIAKTKVTVELSAEVGKFKRVDNKGFNYIVITDANGNEKSYLWLRQFKGSDHFNGQSSSMIGKRLKITFQPMEAYLPAAKGYYDVKEITGIEILK